MPLDETDRAVVDGARAALLPVLDDLRGELLAATGVPAGQLKADGTPITAADRGVHARLARLVAERFPDHGLVSEEGTTVTPDTRWTWVVDPLDGTANFAAGLPYWCVSVALCREGRPVWAVVDAPALDRRYEAELGGGAWLNGVRLEIAQPVDPERHPDRHVPILVTAGIIRRAGQGSPPGSPTRALNPRVLGAIALDLCQVALGGVAAAVHPRPHVWDVAAGWLIVEEAGGAIVVPGRGEPLIPLRPGVDEADRTAPVAAGRDSEGLEDLVAGLPLGDH